MRRILLLLMVAMLVAVMLAVTAGPALAAPGGQSDVPVSPREGGTTPSNSFLVLGEFAPPVSPPGGLYRPESVEPQAPIPFTGPPPQTYD